MRKFIEVFLIGIFLLVTSSASVYAAEQYTVKSGDSLWKIATDNRLTVGQLMSINGLVSDKLMPGQVLKLNSVSSTNIKPKVDLASGYYTVQSGDSLWKISQQCGLSVQQLKELNNLNSDFLQVGQQLSLRSSVAQSTVAAVPEPSTQPVQSQEEPSRSGNVADGSRVVQVAANYLGTPYRYGGTSPQGFDCSGFAQYVYKQAGYSLNRTAASQYQQGVWVDKNNLLPGDLVFFSCGSSGINHVGIYSGSNQFIHSSSSRSGGVIYSSLMEGYYAGCYVGAKRIIR